MIELLIAVLVLLLAAVGLLVVLVLRTGVARESAKLAALQESLETAQLGALRAEFAQTRSESAESDTRQRGELASTLDTQAKASAARLLEFAQRLDKLTDTTQGRADALKESVDERLHRLNESQTKQLTQFASRLDALTKTTKEQADVLRSTVQQSMDKIREANEQKLEQMRKTVDEKLQGTLEKRLGESFRTVSEQLKAVHAGLGEMQNLAQGVGDLKRVMTNVKTRGTWGEYQLANLLEQVLTPEQYESNVAVNPATNDRVEFAVKLPGDGDVPVWLPIDAKLPVEDYERLQQAVEAADPAAVLAAQKALARTVTGFAKSVSEKYVAPPHTTNFALLFVPTEGLYAELARQPGLIDNLQSQQRVTLAGPSTLLAQLNALQMGFRTLALQERSAEVWQVLGEVKDEFGKFGGALDAVKKKLQEASNKVDAVGVRTRAMDRKLRTVETQGLDAVDELTLLTGDGSDAVDD